jgi:hypothetical protein
MAVPIYRGMDFTLTKFLILRHVTVVCDTPSCNSGLYNTPSPLLPYLTIVEVPPPTLQIVKSFLCDSLKGSSEIIQNDHKKL